jgi:hypothetical protein
MDAMKALTLFQPWASLVALGIKKIETRHWSTAHRGPLAIHAGSAGRSLDGDTGAYGQQLLAHPLLAPLIQQYQLPAQLAGWPFSCILGTVDLHSCRRSSDFNRAGSQISELELLLGDYSDGRYGWMMADPVLFVPPVPSRGLPGLWDWKAAA